MRPRDSETVFGADYARQWRFTDATIRNWRMRGKATPIGYDYDRGALYRRADLDHARTTRRPHRRHPDGRYANAE